ncbi:MAG: 4Fe-4S binding protein, partial [Oscillospiraceae bacterium]
MLEYLDSNNKSKCYGCRSCEQVCPVNAIVMTTDKEGFLYPKIDKEKCIDCLLCEKSCPYMNDNNTSSKDSPIVYAVINNNEDILKSS